ncbi:hypothetical protein CKA32_000264 [Geitlerinema sp. FC II]|nr:hypothetical protein CKA32_000264 [Geitlerinema sp. FC II]
MPLAVFAFRFLFFIIKMTVFEVTFASTSGTNYNIKLQSILSFLDLRW